MFMSTKSLVASGNVVIKSISSLAVIVHEPSAVVIHPIRPAPWGVSLKQQRKSQFNALLYKNHPDLYRERIHPAHPVPNYATVGSLALAATGAATFCARRLRGTSYRPAHIAEMVVTSTAIPTLSIFWRLRGAIKFRVLFFQ
jgi:hypothetical protein